jgi:glycosyltransferase involved in cell wall biosynthesis
MSATCRILSIAPYRVLPPSTGGHWAVVSLHDTLGGICQDHMLGTSDNGSDEPYSFILHKIFPASVRRYLPMYGLRAAAGIGKRYDATHILCEHPYMAPLAIALSHRLRIPWALRSHNIEAERFRHLGKRWWRLLYIFERYAMRAADAIFFITPEDCSYAIAEYELRHEKCHLAPYGTVLQEQPAGREAARRVVAEQLSLDMSIPWLYFLGVHTYRPNADAVRHILGEIHPRLEAQGIRCEIIIGGKGLPPELQESVSRVERLHYAGFIEDLDTFLKACDVMLNPLSTGGGIKTKAVEALAYNKMVISTCNGAAGILQEVCGHNLIIAPDGDWDAFAGGIARAVHQAPDIPEAFYRHYNWDAIGQHVVQVLGETRLGAPDD